MSEKTSRSQPSCCIFVASLSSAETDAHLCKSVEDHFGKWGTIKNVKVLRDRVNRPYAFVQYSTNEEAKIAIEKGQKTELDGRLLRCEAAKVNRTLFITPVGTESIEKSEVEALLSKYGEVEDVTLAKFSPAVRSPAESWFCRFSYREDAILAYTALRNHPDWHAEWTQNLDSFPEPTKEIIDKFSIFIGRLNFKVTEKEVLERFSRHGEVVMCKVIAKQPFTVPGQELNYEKLTAFAFVTYETEQSAAKAVEEENHTMFSDKTITVQYKEYQHVKRNYILGPKLEFAPPPVNLPSRFTTITAFTPWRDNRIINRPLNGPFQFVNGSNGCQFEPHFFDGRRGGMGSGLPMRGGRGGRGNFRARGGDARGLPRGPSGDNRDAHTGVRSPSVNSDGRGGFQRGRGGFQGGRGSYGNANGRGGFGARGGRGGRGNHGL